MNELLERYESETKPEPVEWKGSEKLMHNWLLQQNPQPEGMSFADHCHVQLEAVKNWANFVTYGERKHRISYVTWLEDLVIKYEAQNATN